MRRNGSALVVAIWTIAVLAIFIMNFAVEAKLQAGVNVYMRNRTHVDKLTETGIAIAETIMLGYQDVQSAPDDEEEEDLLEKLEQDKWLREKRELKNGSLVTEPIAVDWRDPDGGIVTIEIKSKEAKWNINELYAGGNSNYRDIWTYILAQAGVPEEGWDELICGWNDWRDEDDSVSAYESFTGGESAYYRDEMQYEEGEKRYKPRNGPIIDLRELARVKGFRDYPVVLTGGVWNADARTEDQIRVRPILDFFDVFGSGKININAAPREVLMSLPGVDEDNMGETVVDAILELRERPETMDSSSRSDDDYGPFRDWADLVNRLEDSIAPEAQSYVIFEPESYFDVKITGRLGDITHTVKAVALVSNKTVKYIRWQEDP